MSLRTTLEEVRNSPKILKAKKDMCRRMKKHRMKLRNMALDIYGRKCSCCGESNERFLTIDHVNNDGYLHRKNLKNNPDKVIREIIEAKDYTRFTTLCFNCNYGKKVNNGVCPHKEKITTVK